MKGDTAHKIHLKLFISQPSRGKTDEEILLERQEAFVKAKRLIYDEYSKNMFTDINELKIDLELIDSFFQGAPVDAKPLWFLGKSLELLSTADYVYFAPGWENYRGCKIEHLCAEQYGITIIE